MSQRVDEVHTLLGKGSEFEGKLSFEGQVRIDGTFKGEIFTKDTLIVGPGAKIVGEINAGVVSITGSVEGTVRAVQVVELHAPAVVKGTIESPAMTMEKGVRFDGTSKMDGIAKAPAPGKPS